MARRTCACQLSYAICFVAVLAHSQERGFSLPRIVDADGFLKAQKAALVVGVNHYEFTNGFNQLKYAVNDADDLAKTFPTKVTIPSSN